MSTELKIIENENLTIGGPLINYKQDTSNLTVFAEQLADEYLQCSDSTERKKKGQFFTPKEVATFMADMVNIKNDSIKFLDPGAGIGMLTAAFCERLLSENKKLSVSIIVYENDNRVLPYLKKLLNACETALQKKNHKVSAKIIQEDFIEKNMQYLRKDTFFKFSEGLMYYDYIISNPPYYKLNKDSKQSKLMSEFVCGQPNIYASFMALSLKMLSQQGQMVYITPRSFCSGLYFRTFRKWLLKNGNFNRIHMFKSRKDVFTKNEVLQENIIVSVSPSAQEKTSSRVIVSTSDDRQFHNLKEYRFNKEDVLHRSNGDVFIKIPSSTVDVEVQHAVSNWNNTLKDFGMKASTGPVVSFRAREYLSEDFIKSKTLPLLWMHNIQDMHVVWPLQKRKKESAIKLKEGVDSLLLPVSNYVFIKRFSSKEQKRRLYAGVLRKTDFNFKKIGVENHLNYICKLGKELSLEEAYGIAGILNTSLIDIFFRMMNGNTQVNAVDIMNLPMPPLRKIKEMGKQIYRDSPGIGLELDTVVADRLGINKKLVKRLNNGEYGK